MNQGDEIEIVLDRVVIADFLIAAISLIYRIEKYSKRQRQGAGRLDLVTDLEGAIAGSVVDRENLNLIVFRKAGRNPRENALERAFSIVRYHENQHARLLLIRHGREPISIETERLMSWQLTSSACTSGSYANAKLSRRTEDHALGWRCHRSSAFHIIVQVTLQNKLDR